MSPEEEKVMVDARLAVIATLDDILATPNLPEANTGLPFLLNRSVKRIVSGTGPACSRRRAAGRDRPLNKRDGQCRFRTNRL
jgi:hypothetical protein